MMGAAAIGICTSMISAFLQPMTERAGTEILDHFTKMAYIKGEIKNLQITLDLIAGVIQVAEEKQIENVSIRTWLRQLVDIGYEARDVLDDFFTYCSLKKAKKASKQVKSKSSISPSKKTGSSSSSTVSLSKKNQLVNDIRGVRMKLQDLMGQTEIVSNLRSVVRPSGSETETVPTTHERPNPGSFASKQGDLCGGREGVKEDIVQKILNHSTDDVDIIPIWGMGGIGKTTLAQSIYNDVRVTELMYPSKNRLWYFVGKRTLNAEKIIISCIGEQNSTPSVADNQTKLMDKFKGNKFLIVLDDVWDVETSKWDLLFNTLNKVGEGGVVILTTREAKTVDAVNTMLYSLQPLSDEQCWSIFERHAFPRGNSENSSKELRKIGREIVAKIKGLPLAAKLVGSSLLNKRDAKIWRSFLSTKEWLPMLNKDKNAVMPALIWSYDHLRPHLKHCFTYCSLFPKDHVFDEKMLVEMWMAHDILHDVGGGTEPRRPEDIGDEYFKELVNASFFQYIDGKYTMHDMIHDLALLVSDKDFITLSKEDSSSPQMDTVRHVTIIEDGMYSKNLSLCQSKRILTVYTQLDGEDDDSNNPLVKVDVLVDVFKQMKSIRVLVLVDITAIPECIKELKHLRYLDIRGEQLKSLPDSLCDL